MFECFSISCIDCTLKTFEFLYACRTSQKIVWEVYVLEYFLWSILGDISKIVFKNIMTPVRCCKKNQQISDETLLRDVFQKMFCCKYLGNIPQICLRHIIADICKKLIEEYLRRFAKTCFEKLFSEVPPIRPGERNIWETCPKRCVYRFFRRQMYCPFWVEIFLVDTKLEHIPQCFRINL